MIATAEQLDARAHLDQALAQLAAAAEADTTSDQRDARRRAAFAIDEARRALRDLAEATA